MFYRDFSASATVYPTRRDFFTATLYAAEKFLVLRDKSLAVAKSICFAAKCLLKCLPLEGKGDSLRWPFRANAFGIGSEGH